MTDSSNYYEGGLTDEAFDRAEQAGRIHELERRIEGTDGPQAAEIADLERQFAEAQARQASSNSDADAAEGEAIGRELRRIQGF